MVETAAETEAVVEVAESSLLSVAIFEFALPDVAAFTRGDEGFAIFAAASFFAVVVTGVVAGAPFPACRPRELTVACI